MRAFSSLIFLPASPSQWLVTGHVARLSFRRAVGVPSVGRCAGRNLLDKSRRPGSDSLPDRATGSRDAAAADEAPSSVGDEAARGPVRGASRSPPLGVGVAGGGDGDGDGEFSNPFAHRGGANGASGGSADGAEVGARGRLQASAWSSAAEAKMAKRSRCAPFDWLLPGPRVARRPPTRTPVLC